MTAWGIKSTPAGRYDNKNKNKNKNKNIYLSFSCHTYIIENAIQQTQFKFVCNISMELTGTLAGNILRTDMIYEIGY
jgi:hypothetical protein